MGGRLPIHTGLQHYVIQWCQPAGVPLDRPLIAESLKELGYQTAINGKWHLGMYKWAFTPTFRGFDHFFGYYNGAEDYWKHTFRVYGKPYLDLTHYRHRADGYEDFYMTNLQVNQTERMLSEMNPNKPMFLYLPFLATHEPVQAPQDAIDRYKFIKDVTRRTHAAMSAVMDNAVGRVVDLLKKYNYWNNTILIFSSDNGGQVRAMGLNWPYRGGKGTMFEGGSKVTGFVHSPLITVTNPKASALIHATDWYPTFLRLASNSSYVSSPKFSWLDGMDQWDAILSGAAGNRTEILYNIDPLIHVNGYNQAAIRVGDWKLITGDPCLSGEAPISCGWVPLPNNGKPIASPPLSNTTMLFNLSQDPYEKNDVAAQNPSIVASLTARLNAYAQTMVKPNYPPVDPKCNPAQTGGYWMPWR